MKFALATIGLLAVGVVIHAAQARGTTARVPLSAVSSESAAARESARIAAHLAEVEAELRAADVSHLTSAQRASRAGHIEVLRRYRESGVFPHNHDFPAERVPYFVDEHGTLCAMAYLISQSGGDDLVSRVAGTANNARIAELADDAELLAWLEEAGLSVEEAGRIQPMYGCCWPEPASNGSVSTGYAVASTVASGVGGVSIGMNLLSLDDERRWPGVLGITAGAAGMGLGFSRLGDSDGHSRIAAANIGIGAVATALGTLNLFRASADGADVPVRTSGGTSLSAAPLLGVGEKGEAGLVVRMRF
jgi:hypothetical protein